MSWPLFGAQYVAEAEEKLQRARLLVDSVRKEKVDLSNQLEEERRYVLGGHFLSLISDDHDEHSFRTSRRRSNSCLPRVLAVSPGLRDMSFVGLILLTCKVG